MQPIHEQIDIMEAKRRYMLDELDLVYKKICENLSVTDPESLTKLHTIIGEYEALLDTIEGKIELFQSDIALVNEVSKELETLKESVDNFGGGYVPYDKLVPLNEAQKENARTNIDAVGKKHSHDWNSITDKPEEYPSENHNHHWNDIEGKPTSFEPKTHTHLWSQISDKPEEFPPIEHEHDYATETFVTNAIAQAQLGGSDGEVNLDGFATKDDIADMATKTYVDGELKNKVNTSSIKAVATSGSYNDLEDKPTFPSLAEYVKLSDLYAIGAIYITANESDKPAAKFGGTWEQITDMFLVGAGGSYGLGSTGGEASHVLTLAEMPAHEGHLFSNDKPYDIGNATGMYLPQGVMGTDGTVGRGWNNNATEMYPPAYTKGSGNAHNNIPPYFAVNIWRRVA